MKRGGYLQRRTPLKTKTTLRARGKPDTARLKEDIQRLVREIVIKRDGGCFLRSVRHCNGVPGHAVLQADHLITRANSATYADTRLIVCVCRPCHGWKLWHKEQYDHLVRMLLPQDRLELWDKCDAARFKPTRTTASDWQKEIAALRQELHAYAKPRSRVSCGKEEGSPFRGSPSERSDNNR